MILLCSTHPPHTNLIRLSPNIGEEVKLPGIGEGLTSVEVKTYSEEKNRKTKSLTFRVSPFFSVTFHILQRQTPPKVVMMLNKKAIRNMMDVCLTGLHVGLTRIQNEDDIRIWPMREGALDTNHLLALKYPAHLALWDQSYDQNGRFDPKRIEQVLIQHRAEILQQLMGDPHNKHLSFPCSRD